MISTSQIREALLAALTATELFEKVAAFNVADISAGLEKLRDSADSLALIVPSRDEWIHTMALEDENFPARAECRNDFEILVTARDLRHGDDGALSTVQLKDNLCMLLLWQDLSIPGLICLPIDSEPMVIERDERRGREAWKITLQIRQTLLPE